MIKFTEEFEGMKHRQTVCFQQISGCPTPCLATSGFHELYNMQPGAKMRSDLGSGSLSGTDSAGNVLNPPVKTTSLVSQYTIFKYNKDERVLQSAPSVTQCLSQSTIALISHHDQNNVGRKAFISSSAFSLSSSLKEVRQELEQGRNLRQEHAEAMEACCFLAFSS